jgi:hypothetical protein
MAVFKEQVRMASNSIGGAVIIAMLLVADGQAAEPPGAQPSNMKSPHP